MNIFNWRIGGSVGYLESIVSLRALLHHVGDVLDGGVEVVLEQAQLSAAARPHQAAAAPRHRHALAHRVVHQSSCRGQQLKCAHQIIIIGFMQDEARGQRNLIT